MYDPFMYVSIQIIPNVNKAKSLKSDIDYEIFSDFNRII